MQQDRRPQRSTWAQLIATVDAPLGFYVLALLIVEAFLAVALTSSELSESHRFVAMWVGVAMFLVVVAIVTALVWFRPQSLIFDRIAHLIDRGLLPYGSQSNVLFDELEALQAEPTPPTRGGASHGSK